MSSIGTKEQWDAYLEGYRKFNAWEEEQQRHYDLPLEDVLDWMSSLRRMLPPESRADAERGDTQGFSTLLKTLALLRV